MASDKQKGASQKSEAPILNNDNKWFLLLGYLLSHE